MVGNLDYSQYEKNNTLGFALASMMFEDYTHIIVRRRAPGGGCHHIGGSASPAQLIGRFGSLQIESSMVRPDGILQITVK